MLQRASELVFWCSGVLVFGDVRYLVEQKENVVKQTKVFREL